MNPFNFAPTASGAAKVQPMSASDITRINRIRATNGAYPNILSNPPKNIGNLALSQSVVSSFNYRSAINRGIFNYNSVGIEDHSMHNNSNPNSNSNSNSRNIPEQDINTARIVNNKLRVVFTVNRPITDFDYNIVNNDNTVKTLSLTIIDDTTILDNNVYLVEKDLSYFVDYAPVIDDTIIINSFYNNGEVIVGKNVSPINMIIS